MHWEYQLSKKEKQRLIELLLALLKSVKGVASVGGPTEIYCTVRSLSNENTWTDYVYGIHINSNIGSYDFDWGFNKTGNIDKELARAAHTVAAEFWREKDGDYNSILADDIWKK